MARPPRARLRQPKWAVWVLLVCLLAPEVAANKPAVISGDQREEERNWVAGSEKKPRRNEEAQEWPLHQPQQPQPQQPQQQPQHQLNVTRGGSVDQQDDGQQKSDQTNILVLATSRNEQEAPFEFPSSSSLVVVDEGQDEARLECPLPEEAWPHQESPSDQNYEQVHNERASSELPNPTIDPRLARPGEEADVVSLVFWFKDAQPTPVYTLDARPHLGATLETSTTANSTDRKQHQLPLLKKQPNNNHNNLDEHLNESPRIWNNPESRQDRREFLSDPTNRRLLQTARHYPSDPSHFRLELAARPLRLQLLLVRPEARDSGLYRCRIDFRRAPTISHSRRLLVQAPLGEPKLFVVDEENKKGNSTNEVTSQAATRIHNQLVWRDLSGSLKLGCYVSSGSPKPLLEWLIEYSPNTPTNLEHLHQLSSQQFLVRSSEGESEGVAGSELTIAKLSSTHLDGVRLTCRASHRKWQLNSQNGKDDSQRPSVLVYESSRAPKWIELKLRLPPKQVKIGRLKGSSQIEWLSESQQKLSTMTSFSIDRSLNETASDDDPTSGRTKNRPQHAKLELDIGQESSLELVCLSSGSQPLSEPRWRPTVHFRPVKRTLPLSSGELAAVISLDRKQPKWNEIDQELVCETSNDLIEAGSRLETKLNLSMKYEPQVSVKQLPSRPGSRTVRLKCIAESNPPINQIFWLLNGRKLVKLYRDNSEEKLLLSSSSSSSSSKLLDGSKQNNNSGLGSEGAWRLTWLQPDVGQVGRRASGLELELNLAEIAVKESSGSTSGLDHQQDDTGEQPAVGSMLPPTRAPEDEPDNDESQCKGGKTCDEYKCLAINSVHQSGLSGSLKVSRKNPPRCARGHLTAGVRYSRPEVGWLKLLRTLAAKSTGSESGIEAKSSIECPLELERWEEEEEEATSGELMELTWTFWPLARMAELLNRLEETSSTSNSNEQDLLQLINSSAPLYLSGFGARSGRLERPLPAGGVGLLLCRARNAAGWQSGACLSLVGLGGLNSPLPVASSTPSSSTLSSPTAAAAAAATTTTTAVGSLDVANCSLDWFSDPYPSVVRFETATSGSPKSHQPTTIEGQLALSVDCSVVAQSANSTLLFQLAVEPRQAAGSSDEVPTGSDVTTTHRRTIWFAEQVGVPSDSPPLNGSSSRVRLSMGHLLDLEGVTTTSGPNYDSSKANRLGEFQLSLEASNLWQTGQRRIIDGRQLVSKIDRSTGNDRIQQSSPSPHGGRPNNQRRQQPPEVVELAVGAASSPLRSLGSPGPRPSATSSNLAVVRETTTTTSSSPASSNLLLVAVGLTCLLSLLSIVIIILLIRIRAKPDVNQQSHTGSEQHQLPSSHQRHSKCYQLNSGQLELVPVVLQVGSTISGVQMSRPPSRQASLHRNLNSMTGEFNENHQQQLHLLNVTPRIQVAPVNGSSLSGQPESSLDSGLAGTSSSTHQHEQLSHLHHQVESLGDLAEQLLAGLSNSSYYSPSVTTTTCDEHSSPALTLLDGSEPIQMTCSRHAPLLLDSHQSDHDVPVYLQTNNASYHHHYNSNNNNRLVLLEAPGTTLWSGSEPIELETDDQVSRQLGSLLDLRFRTENQNELEPRLHNHNRCHHHELE